MFGLGWGITGVCPAPALLLAGAGFPKVALGFMPALMIGMYAASAAKAPPCGGAAAKCPVGAKGTWRSLLATSSSRHASGRPSLSTTSAGGTALHAAWVRSSYGPPAQVCVKALGIAAVQVVPLKVLQFTSPSVLMQCFVCFCFLHVEFCTKKHAAKPT